MQPIGKEVVDLARKIVAQVAARNVLGRDMIAYLAKLPNMPVSKTKARSELRAQVVKALAHPSRLLIAEALIDGEQCVCDLTEVVGADISTVSKHLLIMKAAGLVEADKRGLNVFYRLRCPCLGDFFRCVDTINRGHMNALKHAAA
jgi:ArsR family transcriptional regulator